MQPSSTCDLHLTTIGPNIIELHCSSVSTTILTVMSARSRVFSAYRRIFKARKELFQGDHQAMMESRAAIKSEFLKNRDAPTSGEHFEGLLSMVDEAVDMLLRGIVRGDLNSQSGNYGELNDHNVICHFSQFCAAVCLFFSCPCLPSLIHLLTAIVSYDSEVKFKPQHTEGVDHSNVEPITPETVSKMERPMVETSRGCSSKKPSS